MTVSMSLNHQRLRPPPILNKPIRCPMAWGIVAAAVPLAIRTTREDSGCEGAGCEVSCTECLGYFFGTGAGFETTGSTTAGAATSGCFTTAGACSAARDGRVRSFDDEPGFLG